MDKIVLRRAGRPASGLKDSALFKTVKTLKQNFSPRLPLLNLGTRDRFHIAEAIIISLINNTSDIDDIFYDKERAIYINHCNILYLKIILFCINRLFIYY